jgi:hypothetical protein
LESWLSEVAAKQTQLNQQALAAKPSYKDYDVQQLSTPFTADEVKGILENKMKNMRDPKGRFAKAAVHQPQFFMPLHHPAHRCRMMISVF